MSEADILRGIKDYFAIHEFVDKTTFDRHGERAWQFICPRLLHTILVIRDEIDKPITINNWKWGGGFSQRGLRTNVSHIVSKKTDAGKLYLSAHCMGKAIDFDVKGMTAPEVREWIQDNEDLLPYKVRLENSMNGKPINWVHLDVYYLERNPKIKLFDV